MEEGVCVDCKLGVGCRTDHAALPSCGFSLQDRSDNEVEKVKSALVLCYGHVALCAPPKLVLARIETDILRNVLPYFHTKVSLAAALLQGVGKKGALGPGPQNPDSGLSFALFRFWG